jgi:hypothetical protein
VGSGQWAVGRNRFAAALLFTAHCPLLIIL